MMIVPMSIASKHVATNKHKILHNVEQHGQHNNAAKRDLFLKKQTIYFITEKSLYVLFPISSF